MKRKREGMNGLAESLGLPLDASRGETILTFVGRSMVRIENYRSILVYSDTYFKDPGWENTGFPSTEGTFGSAIMIRMRWRSQGI